MMANFQRNLMKFVLLLFEEIDGFNSLDSQIQIVGVRFGPKDTVDG
jgi:hypothetical protein